MVEYASQIIAFAEDRIGLSEDPRDSNDGHELRLWLAGTPWQPGDPWCIDFCLRCLLAGFGSRDEIPAHIEWTGSAHELAAAAQRAGQLSPYPATGSIAVFRGGPTGFYHGGIVRKVNMNTNMIETIEGNTNNTGSPEGYEVCTHTRHFKDALYVIW